MQRLPHGDLGKYQPAFDPVPGAISISAAIRHPTCSCTALGSAIA
jgi:hypothetical protein